MVHLDRTSFSSAMEIYLENVHILIKEKYCNEAFMLYRKAESQVLTILFENHLALFSESELNSN